MKGLWVHTSNCEITYGSVAWGDITTNPTKAFIIDHPDDSNKHLVHACLEGPESGIYYRGKNEIKNNEYCEIKLPDYVTKLGNDFTIQVTPIYSGKDIKQLYVSQVKNNSFFVYGQNTKFSWLVHASREKIIIEQNKKDIKIKGQGPYSWY